MDPRRLVLACVLSLSACDDTKKASSDATPSPEPAATQAPAAEPAAPKSPSHALLDWLDPDAVAIVYTKMAHTVDADAFATAFAVPPKLARMLRDVPAVDEALDAISDPGDPRPGQWLGPEAVASTSVVSSGTYVLRPLLQPRAEVEALLERAGMTADTIEGFTVYLHRGAFPWKVAFLTDTVVAFVPVKEIGTGLSPLTAGRDLPPSEAETELRTVLDEDPGTALEAFAAGPLLHLDLGQDLAQYAVRARPFQRTGLEVEVRLAPIEDPMAAAGTLGDRDLSLETDALAALAKKVAFTVEGPVVVGRLQMPATEVATLAEG